MTDQLEQIMTHWPARLVDPIPTFAAYRTAISKGIDPDAMLAASRTHLRMCARRNTNPMGLSAFLDALTITLTGK